MGQAQEIKTFRGTLERMKSQLSKNEFVHFPLLRAAIAKGYDPKKQKSLFVAFIDFLMKNFNKRFADFDNMESIFNFVENPYQFDPINSTISKEIAEFLRGESEEAIDAEMRLDEELSALQKMKVFWNNSEKQKLDDLSSRWITVFGNIEIPLLQELYDRVASMFSSSYLCESFFSHMKFIKSKNRSRILDEPN